MSKEKSTLQTLNESFRENLQATITRAQEKNYQGMQAEIKKVVDNYLEDLKKHIPNYQKPEKK